MPAQLLTVTLERTSTRQCVLPRSGFVLGRTPAHNASRQYRTLTLRFCASSTAARSVTIAATPGSLPMRNFVAISHAVAALANTALLSSAMAE
jgi:hypothetical protein